MKVGDLVAIQYNRYHNDPATITWCRARVERITQSGQVVVVPTDGMLTFGEYRFYASGAGMGSHRSWRIMPIIPRLARIFEKRDIAAALSECNFYELNLSTLREIKNLVKA